MRRAWVEAAATVIAFGCASIFLYARSFPDAWLPLTLGVVMAAATLLGSRLRARS